MTTAHNTINLSQLCACSQDASHANKPKNSCEFCETRGLPILPLRYAVTAIDPHLPSVPLPQALATTAFEQHQYTLRLMRTGYLYLYDEANKRCAGWFITPDAKFFHYALNDTDANGLPRIVNNIRSDESKTRLMKCNDKSHYLPASMIRWPLKGCRRLWLMYSELPIPTQALHSLVNQDAWRTDNMQPIDASAWAAGQYAQPDVFQGTQVGNYLAEIHASSGTTYDCHPYIVDPILSTGIALQKKLNHFFEAYYQKNGQQGLAIALRDDIAAIETLNHARHLPERVMQSAIGNPDKGLRALTAEDYERQRQLQCYCLINIVNDKEARNGQQEIDLYNERYRTSSGRDTLAMERVAPMSMSGTSSTAFSDTIEHLKNNLPTPEQNAATVEEEVKKNQQAIYNNFSEHVDVAAFETFKSYFDTAVATRDKALQAADKDYSSFAD